MDGAADAVTGQPADHSESLTVDLAADRAADLVDEHSGAGDRQRRRERRVRAGREPARGIGRPLDHDRPRRIRDVAVLLHRDVELHQIAMPNLSRSGDAVHDLVVDADEHRAGKPVDDRRGRAGAVRGKDAGGHVVELGGGDAWTDMRFERVERQPGDVPDLPQPSPVSW